MLNNWITLSRVAKGDERSELALDKVIRLCYINARNRQNHKNPPTLKPFIRRKIFERFTLFPGRLQRGRYCEKSRMRQARKIEKSPIMSLQPVRLCDKNVAQPAEKHCRGKIPLRSPVKIFCRENFFGGLFKTPFCPYTVRKEKVLCLRSSLFAFIRAIVF